MSRYVLSSTVRTTTLHDVAAIQRGSGSEGSHPRSIDWGKTGSRPQVDNGMEVAELAHHGIIIIIRLLGTSSIEAPLASEIGVL